MHVDTKLSLILGAPCRASGPVALCLLYLTQSVLVMQYDTDMDHACKHD